MNAYKPYFWGVLASSLNGAAWLYSTVALIFSIASAFIIQTQWNRWDRLENAVRLEVSGFWELASLSDQLPAEIRDRVRKSIAQYLKHLIYDEDWKTLDRGGRIELIESAITKLQIEIFSLSKSAQEYSALATNIFLNIQSNRNDRLHYSSGHIPSHLYFVIGLATFLVIFLSLFIAIPNPVIDYVFTMSVSLLSFSFFMIIEDLNHPYRPGSWHLKKDPYVKLLAMILPS